MCGRGGISGGSHHSKTVKVVADYRDVLAIERDAALGVLSTAIRVRVRDPVSVSQGEKGSEGNSERTTRAKEYVLRYFSNRDSAFSEMECSWTVFQRVLRNAMDESTVEEPLLSSSSLSSLSSPSSSLWTNDNKKGSNSLQRTRSYSVVTQEPLPPRIESVSRPEAEDCLSSSPLPLPSTLSFLTETVETGIQESPAGSMQGNLNRRRSNSGSSSINTNSSIGIHRSMSTRSSSGTDGIAASRRRRYDHENKRQFFAAAEAGQEQEDAHVLLGETDVVCRLLVRRLSENSMVTRQEQGPGREEDVEDENCNDGSATPTAAMTATRLAAPAPIPIQFSNARASSFSPSSSSDSTFAMASSATTTTSITPTALYGRRFIKSPTPPPSLLSPSLTTTKVSRSSSTVRGGPSRQGSGSSGMVVHVRKESDDSSQAEEQLEVSASTAKATTTATGAVTSTASTSSNSSIRSAGTMDSSNSSMGGLEASPKPSLPVARRMPSRGRTTSLSEIRPLDASTVLSSSPEKQKEGHMHTQSPDPNIVDVLSESSSPSLSSSSPESAAEAQPVSCGCEHHCKNAILSTIVPLSLEACFEMLFSGQDQEEGEEPRESGCEGEGGGNRLVCETHFRMDGSDDVKFTPWVKDGLTEDENELNQSESVNKWQGRKRRLEYSVAFRMPVFLKTSTSCVELQEILQHNQRVISIHSESRTPNVPFGDHFSTINQICMTWVSPSKTRIKCFTEVVFKKHIFLSSTVEASSFEGSSGYYKELIRRLVDEEVEPDVDIEATGAGATRTGSMSQEFGNSTGSLLLDRNPSSTSLNLSGSVIERSLSSSPSPSISKVTEPTGWPTFSTGFSSLPSSTSNREQSAATATGTTTGFSAAQSLLSQQFMNNPPSRNSRRGGGNGSGVGHATAAARLSTDSVRPSLLAISLGEHWRAPYSNANGAIRTASPKRTDTSAVATANGAVTPGETTTTELKIADIAEPAFWWELSRRGMALIDKALPVKKPLSSPSATATTSASTSGSGSAEDTKEALSTTTKTALASIEELSAEDSAARGRRGRQRRSASSASSNLTSMTSDDSLGSEEEDADTGVQAASSPRGHATRSPADSGTASTSTLMARIQSTSPWKLSIVALLGLALAISVLNVWYLFSAVSTMVHVMQTKDQPMSASTSILPQSNSNGQGRMPTNMMPMIQQQMLKRQSFLVPIQIQTEMLRAEILELKSMLDTIAHQRDSQ
ncbi:hypothetical protein BGZ99_003607 [Dissophora globulifera]|uniref:VASt domain-containing protein n=1 Tax=Dissophora globulifera TaxID=979702 RepID=A0A9P6RML0_9FUNG|nr:hypothetical protein BGZ99_003607 [Dissophora globulifera]